MSQTRPSIAEILEECNREREVERTEKLAHIGEHVCRPRRLFRFSGLHAEVVCETCEEPMRETSVLSKINKKQLTRRKS